MDVGQGDAIFIDTSDQDVLIDAGRRSAGSTVADYIARVSDPTVEILMASNHDADHMGGLVTVMDALPVLTVWDSGSVKSTQIYGEFITRAQTRHFILVERGQVYQLDPITRVTVLNPTRPLEFSGENDNSIVLKIEVGQVSFLFAGDCEIRCEQSVANAGFDLTATFLKVGHHGSRTSSNPLFIARIKPKYGLI
jgi:beta-lactamase superfamily II metal-dependent hydrolase